MTVLQFPAPQKIVPTLAQRVALLGVAMRGNQRRTAKLERELLQLRREVFWLRNDMRIIGLAQKLDQPPDD